MAARRSPAARAPARVRPRGQPRRPASFFRIQTRFFGARRHACEPPPYTYTSCRTSWARHAHGKPQRASRLRGPTATPPPGRAPHYTRSAHAPAPLAPLSHTLAPDHTRLEARAQDTSAREQHKDTSDMAQRTQSKSCKQPLARTQENTSARRSAERRSRYQTLAPTSVCLCRDASATPVPPACI